MISTIKSFDELPVCLRVEDIMRIMGISRATAFNWVKEPGFPLIRCGRRLIIPRDKFRQHLEEQTRK